MEIDQMEEVGNLAQAKRDWEELISNPAWAQLVKAVQDQVDGLQQQVLFAPITDENNLYMVERQKGMLEGRLSLQRTAQALMESVALDFNMAVAKKGTDNADS